MILFILEQNNEILKNHDIYIKKHEKFRKHD